MAIDFEWDEAKDKANLIKHGISFFQAVETFFDPNGIKVVDSGHSGSEQRFFWIGMDSQGKLLTSRFTMRGNIVRIIGCGNWRRFRKYYYEAIENE